MIENGQFDAKRYIVELKSSREIFYIFTVEIVILGVRRQLASDGVERARRSI